MKWMSQAADEKILKKSTRLRDGATDILIKLVDPKTRNSIELSQRNEDTQRVLFLAQIQGLQVEHNIIAVKGMWLLMPKSVNNTLNKSSKLWETPSQPSRRSQ